MPFLCPRAMIFKVWYMYPRHYAELYLRREVGQPQAEGVRWFQGYRKLSHGRGNNSKQLLLTPERLAMASMEQRHLHRIAVWYYEHDDICGQWLISLFVTSMLRLEEEFSGKQSIRSLQRLILSPASSLACPNDCIHQERAVVVEQKTSVVDITRMEVCSFQ
ncbi:hypothetical protein TNCV_646751 [Trichonephila clavipes]|nr:hypothetical protein TNCV_646751 [Trichonephila clavipes]